MTRCFVCNRIKEESNHWWAVYLSTTIPHHKCKSLTVMPLSAAAGSDFKAACGNHCASKLLERYLQNGSLEAPQRRDAARTPHQANTGLDGDPVAGVSADANGGASA